MHLENRAMRFMEPCENPNVLSGLDAVEALYKSWMDFQSCIGRALPSLTGSPGALLEGGMYRAVTVKGAVATILQKTYVIPGMPD